MIARDQCPRIVVMGVAARADHFMPASLVGSQLELFQPLRTDEAGQVAGLPRPVDELANRFGVPAVAALSGGTR